MGRLYDHELIPGPGAAKPTLTRAAALNLTTRSWRRLPDSPILGTAPWIRAGDRLVNPTLGGTDGGQVGNWGRTDQRVGEAEHFGLGGGHDRPAGQDRVDGAAGLIPG